MALEVWDMQTSRLDISLLAGLRRDTREHLLAAGITTLEQIVALQPEELARFRGINRTAYRLHAHARAWVEQQPIWYNPLPEHCRQAGFMFDLETDPWTGIPWSLSWSWTTGTVHIALVAPDYQPCTLHLRDGQSVTVVPHWEDAWRVFAGAVADTPCPVYHWSGFDAGVMRRTAPPEVRQRLDGCMVDLLQAFNHTVRLPVSSSSLKTVAGYLDFRWSAYDSWEQAYHDYQRWLRQQDDYGLAQACTYQRDDVLALGLVWQWLVDNS